MKLFLLASLPFLFAAPTAGPFEGHQVFRIKIQNESQDSMLKSLVEDSKFGLSEWKHGHDMMDVQVPPTALEEFKAKLQGLEYQVFIENLQKLIDEQSEYSEKLAATQRPLPLDAKTLFTDYRSTEEINIGTTFENRAIRGVKFGTGPQQIVFHGGIHAREWISPATVTFVANFLTSDDARAVKLREQFTFHVVPVLNPDGYAFTRASTRNRLRRKNREPNQGQSCLGTDVNRNFGYKWGGPGASGSPCSDTYRGPAPFSSREAKALEAYIKSLTNVISYLDFHSYSQLWLYPWGYDCRSRSPDDKQFFEVSQLAVDALKTKYGTRYKFGPSCSTIYQTSGTTVDHIYGADGVKYSMTLELRDTGRHGFTLPATQIVPTGEETIDALVVFWDYIAKNK